MTRYLENIGERKGHHIVVRTTRWSIDQDFGVSCDVLLRPAHWPYRSPPESFWVRCCGPARPKMNRLKLQPGDVIQMRGALLADWCVPERYFVARLRFNVDLISRVNESSDPVATTVPTESTGSRQSGLGLVDAPRGDTPLRGT